MLSLNKKTQVENEYDQQFMIFLRCLLHIYLSYFYNRVQSCLIVSRNNSDQNRKNNFVLKNDINDLAKNIIDLMERLNKISNQKKRQKP